MDIKKFKPVLHSILLSILLFAVHKLVFMFLSPNPETGFHFSLLALYGFFAVCSIIITGISILVKQKSINNVGQIFLLTTFIQIGFCFAVFYQPLNVSGAVFQTEKANFITVFLLFLAIETILTVRLLNKNQ